MDRSENASNDSLEERTTLPARRSHSQTPSHAVPRLLGSAFMRAVEAEPAPNDTGLPPDDFNDTPPSPSTRVDNFFDSLSAQRPSLQRDLDDSSYWEEQEIVQMPYGVVLEFYRLHHRSRQNVQNHVHEDEAPRPMLPLNPPAEGRPPIASTPVVGRVPPDFVAVYEDPTENTDTAQHAVDTETTHYRTTREDFEEVTNRSLPTEIFTPIENIQPPAPPPSLVEESSNRIVEQIEDTDEFRDQILQNRNFENSCAPSRRGGRDETYMSSVEISSYRPPPPESVRSVASSSLSDYRNNLFARRLGGSLVMVNNNAPVPFSVDLRDLIGFKITPLSTWANNIELSLLQAGYTTPYSPELSKAASALITARLGGDLRRVVTGKEGLSELLKLLREYDEVPFNLLDYCKEGHEIANRPSLTYAIIVRDIAMHAKEDTSDPSAATKSMAWQVLRPALPEKIRSSETVALVDTFPSEDQFKLLDRLFETNRRENPLSLVFRPRETVGMVTATKGVATTKSEKIEQLDASIRRIENRLTGHINNVENRYNKLCSFLSSQPYVTYPDDGRDAQRLALPPTTQPVAAIEPNSNMGGYQQPAYGNRGNFFTRGGRFQNPRGAGMNRGGPTNFNTAGRGFGNRGNFQNAQNRNFQSQPPRNFTQVQSTPAVASGTAQNERINFGAQGSTQPANQRFAFPARDDFCWYHRRFGNMAQKCQETEAGTACTFRSPGNG